MHKDIFGGQSMRATALVWYSDTIPVKAVFKIKFIPINQ